MDNLTDINEILKYLATFGISSRYNNNGCIWLNSEYCENISRHPLDLIKCYRFIYMGHEYYKLLDDLLINCQIGDKYFRKSGYDIEIYYSFYENYFSLHTTKYFRFDCINDLLAHMREKHSECIRPVEIKIALK